LRVLPSAAASVLAMEVDGAMGVVPCAQAAAQARTTAVPLATNILLAIDSGSFS